MYPFFVLEVVVVSCGTPVDSAFVDIPPLGLVQLIPLLQNKT